MSSFAGDLRSRGAPRPEQRVNDCGAPPEVAARLEAALDLAAQGFLIGQCYGVNPNGGCGCGQVGCRSPGKHGSKGWKDDATQDREVIRHRFRSGSPNYMAIPTAGSGLVVIDEDVPGTLEALGEIPNTLVVLTSKKAGGYRGRHVYGRLPEGISEGDLPYRWAGGEVRVGGNGGVVGPMCQHHSGSTYDLVSGSVVATLPKPWIGALIASSLSRVTGQGKARDPGEPDRNVSEPGRHPWLTSMAGTLRWDGLSGAGLRDSLHYLNALHCRPPLPEDEVDGIAEWAANRPEGTSPDIHSGPPTRPTPRNVGLSLPPPDVDDWVIEGVLRPGAILVVAAPEGLGKSYVRKEIAARLTTCGGSLFGHYPVLRSCSVLEVDEENGEAEEFRREEQVFAALDVNRADAVEYWSASFPALDLGDDGARGYLRDQVAEIRPGVLMLDTGTSMVGDEWGAELKAAIRFLRSLTIEFGCAIVIFVHLVKPPRGKDRTYRMHGSAIGDVMGQWTRPADSVAILADLGKGRASWSMLKKVPRSELVIAQSDGLWKVEEVGQERAPTSDDRVLRAIATGGVNPDSISKALALSSRAVSSAIARLRRDGLLAEGYPYRVTAAGRQALT